MSNSLPGIFVTGSDTGVGKTYVAAAIARGLAAQGLRIGVYKPAASGCRLVDGVMIADDALALWNAAGQPGSLDEVCPQRFAAPLAPHLAAQAQGAQLDRQQLRSGLEVWRPRCDFLIVEGAGGLLSPLGTDETVADLAADLQLPLVIVAANRIGAINQMLLTLCAARAHTPPLPVLGVVLNEVDDTSDDPSVATNASELERRIDVPLLADLRLGEIDFPAAGLARIGPSRLQ